MTKRCPRCKLSYANPLVSFGKASERKDGLKVYCRQCCKEQQRAYQRKNAEKIKTARRTYWAAYYARNIIKLRIAAARRWRTRYASMKRDKVRWLITLRRLDTHGATCHPPVKKTTVKICRTCKVEYSNPRESFHADLTKPDGLRLHCKECRRKYKREKYAVKDTPPVFDY